MRASNARSGPIAKAASVTTMRKNNTPMGAPPPCARQGSNRGAAGREPGLLGGFARANPSHLARQEQFSAWGNPQCAMGGRYNDASAREVFCHDARQQRLALLIEAGIGFIQEPDWTWHKKQACQGDTAALPGGEVERWHLCERRGTQLRKSADDVSRSTQQVSPEREVFGDPQGRLKRILVAHIVRLLAYAELLVSTIEREKTRAGPEQTGNKTQQRRLARPVPPRTASISPFLTAKSSFRIPGGLPGRRRDQSRKGMSRRPYSCGGPIFWKQARKNPISHFLARSEKTPRAIPPPRSIGNPKMSSLDSFKCCKTLKVGSKTYAYYSLLVAEKNGLKGISRLPFSMKVLLENLLRHERTAARSRRPISRPWRNG